MHLQNRPGTTQAYTLHIHVTQAPKQHVKVPRQAAHLQAPHGILQAVFTSSSLNSRGGTNQPAQVSHNGGQAGEYLVLQAAQQPRQKHECSKCRRTRKHRCTCPCSQVFSCVQRNVDQEIPFLQRSRHMREARDGREAERHAIYRVSVCECACREQGTQRPSLT